jgi:hypothetical protein
MDTSSVGIFTVKGAYMELLNRSSTASSDDSMVNSLELLWKNNVPSKISIFGWRLLLEKLPTKEALFDKGIIINISDKSRVFCSNNDESIHHVFLHCTMSSTVWRKIFT